MLADSKKGFASRTYTWQYDGRSSLHIHILSVAERIGMRVPRAATVTGDETCMSVMS